ncbi:hypothetical protein AVEN_144035-1 [Araneus ventricosus]|uniref:Uncharacterized protein n=1 Tax=Araneus ventricosus TaxID=182803 RepID=A0A4Y2DI43_ARAVE|nr:hypothetical protein AVEN_144035-1 [Araneus ventricosus]
MLACNAVVARQASYGRMVECRLSVPGDSSLATRDYFEPAIGFPPLMPSSTRISVARFHRLPYIRSDDLILLNKIINLFFLSNGVVTGDELPLHCASSAQGFLLWSVISST